MFGVGVSAMIMQVFFMVQQTLLYRQAFRYGGDPNAILMSATLRFYGFSFIPIWGMSQGLQPIIGTNFGAKQYDRVKETMKIFSIGGTVLAAIFWLPAQVFSKQLLGLFKVSQDIISSGVNNFRIFYSVFILYGIMIMTITFSSDWGWKKSWNDRNAKTVNTTCSSLTYIAKNIWSRGCLVGRTSCRFYYDNGRFSNASQGSFKYECK